MVKCNLNLLKRTPRVTIGVAENILTVAGQQTQELQTAPIAGHAWPEDRHEEVAMQAIPSGDAQIILNAMAQEILPSGCNLIYWLSP